MSGDRCASGVDGRVSLEVIESTTHPPAPCGENPPIVGLSRHAVIDESDYPLAESGPIIRLNSAGIHGCERPTESEHLRHRLGELIGLPAKEDADARHDRDA